MKKVGLIFLLLYSMVIFESCAVVSEKNTLSVREDNNTYQTDMPDYSDKKLNTLNCMIDEKEKLLVKSGDMYEPYTYEKLPDISQKLVQIIQLLCEGDNNISLEYNDKLSLYYVLEKKKSQLVGGKNGVDIFNFSIDREQDIIEFCVKYLTFPELVDDYSSQLFETFNLLFGKSGEDIYRYLMEFYRKPVDGVVHQTYIDGMQVTYKCTPEHELVISLDKDSDTEIDNEKQLSSNSESNNGTDNKYNESVETLNSEDNKTSIAVYTYTRYEKETEHIIDKIVVNDGDSNFEIDDIAGYYSDLRWVLGQSKAVIEYYGRLWQDFIIIDTKKKEVIFERSFTFEQVMEYFKKQGVVFNYKVNEHRPDIGYRLNTMIDEDNIRIEYIVHDEDYVTQSGSFVYNLSKGTFSELIQNEPKIEG